MTAGYTGLTAYNYTKQQWVEGEEARQILIEQRKQLIELLSGPDADQYCRFEQIVSKQGAIDLARKELVELEWATVTA